MLNVFQTQFLCLNAEEQTQVSMHVSLGSVRRWLLASHSLSLLEYRMLTTVQVCKFGEEEISCPYWESNLDRLTHRYSRDTFWPVRNITTIKNFTYWYLRWIKYYNTAWQKVFKNKEEFKVTLKFEDWKSQIVKKKPPYIAVKILILHYEK